MITLNLLPGLVGLRGARFRLPLQNSELAQTLKIKEIQVSLFVRFSFQVPVCLISGRGRNHQCLPLTRREQPRVTAPVMVPRFRVQCLQVPSKGIYVSPTLPETNMETQEGPYKDYSPLKGGYMGFHVSLGECICNPAWVGFSVGLHF